MLREQEGVAREVLYAGVSSNSHKKYTEAAELGRMKIIKTHKIMVGNKKNGMQPSGSSLIQ